MTVSVVCLRLKVLGQCVKQLHRNEIRRETHTHIQTNRQTDRQSEQRERE